jgi:hypothetical protein
MIDIEIDRGDLRSRELMVVEARALTDSGEAFLDAYIPEGEYHVVDAGRLIIREGEAAALIALATERGLSTEVVR